MGKHCMLAKTVNKMAGKEKKRLETCVFDFCVSSGPTVCLLLIFVSVLVVEWGLLYVIGQWLLHVQSCDSACLVISFTIVIT